MKNRKIIVLWALVILWTIVMFLLAAQSGEDSGKLSGGLTAFLMRLFSLQETDQASFEHFVRKSAHFCMFGLEGILLYSALRESLRIKRKALAIALPACVTLAALNEYTQTFAVNRSCELRDVLIDSAGAFLGVMLTWLCYYLMKSHRRA